VKELYESWISDEPFQNKHFDIGMRKPMYLTLQEHYCCDVNDVVPCDLSDSGVKNAWLPHDLQSIETPVRPILISDELPHRHTIFQLGWDAFFRCQWHFPDDLQNLSAWPDPPP